jgi:hypothetical protein
MTKSVHMAVRGLPPIIENTLETKHHRERDQLKVGASVSTLQGSYGFHDWILH